MNPQQWPLVESATHTGAENSPVTREEELIQPQQTHASSSYEKETAKFDNDLEPKQQIADELESNEVAGTDLKCKNADEHVDPKQRRYIRESQF